MLDFSLATSFCRTPLRGSQWGACGILRLSAKILALLQVSVNFFSYGLQKSYFFCFKELDINKPVFFVSSKQNEGLTDHLGIK